MNQNTRPTITRNFPDQLAQPGDLVMLDGQRYVLIAVNPRRDGVVEHLLRPI